MKKFVCILCVLILCFTLISCSSENADLKETDKLTIITESTTPKLIFSLAMTEFEALYPNVEIEILDCNKLTIPDYVRSLKTMLLAGKGPDIVIDYSSILSLYGLDRMMSSGAFCDLAPFIEADKEFNFSEFNETVLNSGIKDGKRYAMPLSYSVPYILTTQNNLNKTKLTKDSFKNIYTTTEAFKQAELSSDIPVIRTNSSFSFGSTQYISVPFGELDDERVFWNEEEYRKSAESFKPLYESFKYDENYMEISTLAPYEFLSNNKSLFSDSLHDIDLQYYFDNCSAILGAGEEPVYIPLKDENGKVTATAYSFAAIPNGAKNKLNAWRFMKILLSEKLQTNYRDMIYYPVRNSALDMLLAKAEYKYSKDSSGISENGIVLYNKVDEKYFNEFEEAIKNVDNCKFKDSTLYSTVALYLLGYYDNAMTLDETMSIIKDKLELYLTE